MSTGSPVPALLRHFADLRDGKHGDDAVTRQAKESLFADAVGLLAPYAVQVLDEINEGLLLGTGTVADSGFTRHADGGISVAWTLSWRSQRTEGIRPITLEAHYGAGFHHPHLHGATVGEWPLNVFDDAQAAAEVPTLRAIASADLHNLVFQRDYRIVPAITEAAR
jgi:hypothetical protein